MVLRALEVEQTFKKGGNMTKQELIENVKGLTILSKQILNVKLVDQYDVIKLIERLDEPQKPVVPQFVANWIEKCKSEKRRLHESLTYTPFGVNGWVSNPKNQETFARAWLDGYEVEKEKKYYVRFKFIEDSYSYLTLIKHLNTWTLTNIKLDKKFRSEHTKKQLEDAGFGWVFDCPGIEIEDVEE